MSEKEECCVLCMMQRFRCDCKLTEERPLKRHSGRDLDEEKLHLFDLFCVVCVCVCVLQCYLRDGKLREEGKRHIRRHSESRGREEGEAAGNGA